MCNRDFGTPFGGVPIVQEVHDRLPADVQVAWAKFHEWWVEQDWPISRASMPADIAQAYETIKGVPLPEPYEQYTGKNSCYVLGVESHMVD